MKFNLLRVSNTWNYILAIIQTILFVILLIEFKDNDRTLFYVISSIVCFTVVGYVLGSGTGHDYEIRKKLENESSHKKNIS